MVQSYTIEMPRWPAPLFREPEGTARERTLALLKALDNPHEKLPPVVHCAGTNGKGSTLAFLRAMLEAAGYRVHAYHSPHMRWFRERITLAGRWIDDSYLNDCLARCEQAASDEALTVKFFEGTTAAAFLAFSETPADILLLETGMGGRIDATNVVDEPALSIITTISDDHKEFLGPGLAQIAGHKAGILRRDVPAVIGFQPPEALDALQDRAAAIGCPLYIYGEHWAVARAEGERLHFKDQYGSVKLPMPALVGPHQLMNAATAIAAATALEDFTIDGGAIAQGLRDVDWPGRLEEVTGRSPLRRYLRKNDALWYDGGHNAAAGHMLALQAQQWQDEDAPMPLVIIAGTTVGKDVPPMLAPLKDAADRFYGVPVKAEPNAYSAAAMVEAAKQAGLTAIEEADSVEDAVIDAVEHAEGPIRILVFGSLFLRMEVAG